MHKRTLAFLFLKCLFLLKCFNKKVADKMRHLFFLTVETMISSVFAFALRANIVQMVQMARIIFFISFFLLVLFEFPVAYPCTAFCRTWVGNLFIIRAL